MQTNKHEIFHSFRFSCAFRVCCTQPYQAMSESMGHCFNSHCAVVINTFSLSQNNFIMGNKVYLILISTKKFFYTNQGK